MRKSLTNFHWDFEIYAVRKIANRVVLEKCCKMTILKYFLATIGADTEENEPSKVWSFCWRIGGRFDIELFNEGARGRPAKGRNRGPRQLGRPPAAMRRAKRLLRQRSAGKLTSTLANTISQSKFFRTQSSSTATTRRSGPTEAAPTCTWAGFRRPGPTRSRPSR